MLSPKERLFIRKAYEDKVVFESTVLRDAVLNAVYNANRKKGKPFKKLWTKAAAKLTRAEQAAHKKSMDIVKEIESQSSEKGWIARIYKANGYKKKSEKNRGKGG